MRAIQARIDQRLQLGKSHTVKKEHSMANLRIYARKVLMILLSHAGGMIGAAFGAAIAGLSFLVGVLILTRSDSWELYRGIFDNMMVCFGLAGYFVGAVLSYHELMKADEKTDESEQAPAPEA